MAKLLKQQPWFARLAKTVAHSAGHPVSFGTAVAIIVGWAILGPMFHFSDTWQLVINTGTTIVTFLMVFLIQNTQNRDSQAVQLKLDELIRALDGAHTALLDLEELTDHELAIFKKRYQEIARDARKQLKKGLKDTGHPKMDPDC